MRDPFNDLLGASETSPAEQLLTVRFADPAGIVRKQGGATGAAAFLLAPQAITDKIYSEARKSIEDSLREKGIEAEVKVVSGGSFLTKSSQSDLLTGVVLGAGGVGILALVLRMLFRKA